MSNRPIEVSSELSAELRGWNWGAFLLSWIWGLGNRTPVALLALIPLVGFVMMFVLGIKGNQWAWQNENWRSAGDFRRTQKNWAIAGFLVWLAFIVIGVGSVWGLHSLMTSNGAYLKTMETLRTDAGVSAAYGTPIEAGWIVSGSVSIENSRGSADLEIPFSGPKQGGTAYSEAERSEGVWRLTYLATRADGSEEVVIVVPRE